MNVLFLLLAVIWRSVIQYRRTGDIGFRRPVRSAGLLEKAAGLLLVVGVTGLLVSPIFAVAGMASAIGAFDHAGVQVPGLVLACCGVGLTVLAEFQMGDSWRVGVDPAEATTLIERGVFGFIRNPIYSGMLLFALGLFCLVPGACTAAAALLLMLGVEIQVRAVEEPYLAHRHGKAYSDYARHAGRFVPWIGRMG